MSGILNPIFKAFPLNILVLSEKIINEDYELLRFKISEYCQVFKKNLIPRSNLQEKLILFDLKI